MVRIAASVIAALVMTAVVASVVVAVPAAAATVHHGHTVVAVGGPLMAVVTIEDAAGIGGASA